MRRFVAPVAVLAALLLAAGGFLAVASVDDSDSAEPPAAAGRRAPALQRDADGFVLPDGLGSRTPPAGRRPYVGIALAEDEPVIQQVIRGSPAARAGLQEGDVIEAIGGTTVVELEDVAAIVAESEPGDTLTFRVVRNDEGREIALTLGSRPFPLEPFAERLRDRVQGDGILELFEGLSLGGPRGERLERLVEGQLTFLDDDGERVTVRLVAGTIDDASDDRVLVTPNGGERPEEFSITDDTRIVRGLRKVAVDDLAPGDLVVVATRADSKDASTILAFPAHEEESDD